MPSMINNTTAFHPLRWVGGLVLALTLAYLLGLGTNAPAPAAPQCTTVQPSNPPGR